jgi:phosphate:Na+ symporter
MVTGIAGGIGIFLLGMILLTEGLKSAAGEALRGVVQRFTRGPGTALLSGAGLTALVQSSSATTLTTIGFVSAGLLTFPQAVAVIFGANLGTTSTGWLVSVIGFKVSLSVVAFPLVGVGAVMRLLGKGRVAHAGMALAGFGLIFVGIDVLRVGMEGLAELVDPAGFPGATALGRLALVAIGLVMTVVMQSSSAAVATTLTGLHTGSISVEQAAFLVVGQNLGTTVKAALASIGGSVPVKRTAVAHILFNVVTAALALVLLRPLLAGSLAVSGPGEPEVAIAIFHSAFNLLGVIALFPFLAAFSRLVERLVPEPRPTLTRHLDTSVARIPPVAIEAARRSTAAVAGILFQRGAGALVAGKVWRPPPGTDLGEASEALSKIRAFLSDVQTTPGDGVEHERHLSILHSVDHLDGFRRALVEFETRRLGPAHEGDTAPLRARLTSILTHPDGPRGEAAETESGADTRAQSVDVEALPSEPALAGLAAELAEARKSHRKQVLEATATGALAPERAWEEIEVVKILDRLGYHAWRAVRHLNLAGADSAAFSRKLEGGAGISHDGREVGNELEGDLLARGPGAGG